MTLRIDAGWDFARIGDATMTVQDNTGSYTVTFSTGKYCHTDLQAVMGSGNYDDFATALDTALDGLASARTYTVTWNGSSAVKSYAIAVNTGNLGLTFSTHGTAGAIMQHILGFSGDVAYAAGTKTGNVGSYYCVAGAVGAMSEVSDDYAPQSIAYGAEADDGTPYGIGRTGAPVYFDFTISMESAAATLKRKAAAAAPWTFQHLYEHVSVVEPFAVIDDDGTRVHRLRSQDLGGAPGFAPRRAVADWDGAWLIDFKTYRLGSL